MAGKRGNVKVTVTDTIIDRWIKKIKGRETDTAQNVSDILKSNRASLHDLFETKAPQDIKSLAVLIVHSVMYEHMPDADEIDFAIRTARDRYGRLAQNLSAAYSEYMSWHTALHRTDLTDDELLEYLVNLNGGYNGAIKAYYEICKKAAAEKVETPFDIA